MDLTQLQMREDNIHIPIEGRNRKDEIVSFLRNRYKESSINFVMKAFGLLGFIKFTGGYYAIMIDDAEIVGKIMMHEIYEVKKCKMVKLFGNPPDKKREARYADQMRKYLSNEKPDFFFSYTYDMTKNLQDNFIYSMKDKQIYKAFYQRDDMPVFQWNHFLYKNFSTVSGFLNPDKWIVKMIHGSFEQIQIQLYSNVLSVSLVGRRLVQNAGTRYNRRGLNKNVRVQTKNRVSRRTTSKWSRFWSTTLFTATGSL